MAREDGRTMNRKVNKGPAPGPKQQENALGMKMHKMRKERAAGNGPFDRARSSAGSGGRTQFMLGSVSTPQQRKRPKGGPRIDA